MKTNKEKGNIVTLSFHLVGKGKRWKLRSECPSIWTIFFCRWINLHNMSKWNTQNLAQIRTTRHEHWINLSQKMFSGNISSKSIITRKFFWMLRGNLFDCIVKMKQFSLVESSITNPLSWLSVPFSCFWPSFCFLHTLDKPISLGHRFILRILFSGRFCFVLLRLWIAWRLKCASW